MSGVLVSAWRGVRPVVDQWYAPWLVAVAAVTPVLTHAWDYRAGCATETLVSMNSNTTGSVFLRHCANLDPATLNGYLPGLWGLTALGWLVSRKRWVRWMAAVSTLWCAAVVGLPVLTLVPFTNAGPVSIVGGWIGVDDRIGPGTLSQIDWMAGGGSDFRWAPSTWFAYLAAPVLLLYGPALVVSGLAWMVRSRLAQRARSPATRIPCPNCGYLNTPTRVACKGCRMEFPSPQGREHVPST